MAKTNHVKKSAKTGGKTVRKANVKDVARDSLGKELKSLIPKLDAEGLAFLVKQARVHIYNMQVDELNQAAQAANLASAREQLIQGKAEKTRTQTQGKGAKMGPFKITGNDGGTAFYIHYGNDNAIFSKDEISQLVRMVHAGGTDLEIRERVYNWLRRERSDLFSFIPIADKFDDHLKVLTALLKNNFKVKK